MAAEQGYGWTIKCGVFQDAILESSPPSESGKWPGHVMAVFPGCGEEELRRVFENWKIHPANRQQ